MKKQLIRLTEEDLQQIIENSVKRVIKENAEEEGFFNTAKNFANSYRQRGANAIKQGMNNAKQGLQNLKQNA